MQAADSSTVYPPCTVERQDFQSILDALLARDYQIIGPVVSDVGPDVTQPEGVIGYDAVTRVEDLPIGWTEEQDGGVYRLRRRADDAVFGYTLGAQSWKRLLLPPLLRLWQAERTNGEFEFVAEQRQVPKFAFLGVRPCDLRAIQIQDRIFMQEHYRDPDYTARREAALLIAVNCGQAARTCFCASMGSGPAAGAGYDLALTEIMQTERHYFLVEVGSVRGAELLADVTHQAATPADLEAKQSVVTATTNQMGRTLETEGLQQLLYRNFEHPHWEEIASRCLTCGNCTLVCPTCFCTTIEDVTDLTGLQTERWRKVDTCFSVEFSHIFGGSIRTSAKSRYRQWMTHKLASWVDQFGEFGCVGCGRCITWCPVGIDITEEANALRAMERAAPARGRMDTSSTLPTVSSGNGAAARKP